MKEIVFAEKISLYKCESDPAAILKKQDLQIDLFEPAAVRFSAGDYIVLDFGKEMCGSTRILTFTPADARVRIRHGESLTECCSELHGKTNATNDHALRDFEIELPKYSDTYLPELCLRLSLHLGICYKRFHSLFRRFGKQQ